LSGKLDAVQPTKGGGRGEMRGERRQRGAKKIRNTKKKCNKKAKRNEQSQVTYQTSIVAASNQENKQRVMRESEEF
jgi:hypothetical protein